MRNPFDLGKFWTPEEVLIDMFDYGFADYGKKYSREYAIDSRLKKAANFVKIFQYRVALEVYKDIRQNCIYTDANQNGQRDYDEVNSDVCHYNYFRFNFVKLAKMVDDKILVYQVEKEFGTDY